MKLVKTLFLMIAACLVPLSCGTGNPTVKSDVHHELETSAKAATVQIQSGAVAGYVEDGVFTFKGIPYASPPVAQPIFTRSAWFSMTSIVPARPSACSIS